MILVLSPVGFVIALVVLLCLGKVALFTAWTMIPGAVAALAILCGMGHLSIFALNKLEEKRGEPPFLHPGLWPQPNFAACVWLLDEALDGFGRRFEPGAEDREASERSRAFAFASGVGAFFAVFIAAMNLTGQWHGYLLTGRWDPTLPIGGAVAAAAAVAITAYRRRIGRHCRDMRPVRPSVAGAAMGVDHEI